MKIPEKAVLAMIEQLGMTPDEIDEAHVHALNAAAPYIKAQTFREYADGLETRSLVDPDLTFRFRTGMQIKALRSRADRLDPQ